MADSVVINAVTVPIARLASFTFTLHAPDPVDEARALLRIETTSGEVMSVCGPEAVTLKVLLASIGIRDCSQP